MIDPHCRQVVTATGAAALCVLPLPASYGRGVGSVAVGWCCRDAPHLSQNLALSGSRAPQLWQNTPYPFSPHEINEHDVTSRTIRQIAHAGARGHYDGAPNSHARGIWTRHARLRTGSSQSSSRRGSLGPSTRSNSHRENPDLPRQAPIIATPPAQPRRPPFSRYVVMRSAVSKRQSASCRCLFRPTRAG